MISPSFLYDLLKSIGVSFYTGVPDSLLKSFCAYVTEHSTKSNHIIAANEGAAVGLAIGYSLSTGQVPLVYMQNSGVGNALNPLMSLAAPEIYSIPMLLMIGWRGEPGKPDEPQHLKQGRVMLKTLEAMEIPYTILSGEQQTDAEKVKLAANEATRHKCAVALIIKKNIFEHYTLSEEKTADLSLTREEAIKTITSKLCDEDIVIATTGMASRELFEYRKEKAQGHHRDFLTVGGMGHASQIALAISTTNSKRTVVCIDGDGATLMHLGSMAVIGSSRQNNFKHIVLNNGAHDSVGGQPTAGFDICITKIAEGCGYKYVQSVEQPNDLIDSLATFLSSVGPALLEIKVKKGNRKDLGRPTNSPLQNKEGFMKFIQS